MCTYAIGRQGLRRIVEIINEFLTTVYFVKFYVTEIYLIHIHFYVYTRKYLTTCSKSANKPSTSCARTA